MSLQPSFWTAARGAACCWLSAVLAASSLPGAAASSPPPRPVFRYVTELTSESFVELVEQVANNTAHDQAPPYLPLVMFHVTWCNHCKHALPEFEEAAKIVEEAREAGQLPSIQIMPKFFVLECDSTPSATEICDYHTGTSFPATKLFRDHRAFRFNRPRRANVFAWWATHASRTMVTMLERGEHIQQLGQQGPSFILKTDLTSERDEILEAWGQVALDFIESYNFFVVHPHSEAGRLVKGTAPVAVVRGDGIDAAPFKGPFDKEEIAAWANLNRFPPVTDIADWSISDLMGSHLPVVTYVHSGTKDSIFGLAAFNDVVKELRKSTRYLFATINMSMPDTTRFVERSYKLITDHPRIFVFQNDAQYWEDPTLTDPKMITVERLQALMNDSEAYHDGSFRSVLRERRKLLSRLASTSLLGAFIVVVVPSLALSCCWLCARELLRGDDAGEDATVIKKED